MNELFQLIRYVVFYLPFDVGYKALKFMPVRLMCEALKEVYRAKMVHDGVSHAAKLFPNAYLVMVRKCYDQLNFTSARVGFIFINWSNDLYLNS